MICRYILDTSVMYVHIIYFKYIFLHMAHILFLLAREDSRRVPTRAGFQESKALSHQECFLCALQKPLQKVEAELPSETQSQGCYLLKAVGMPLTSTKTKHKGGDCKTPPPCLADGVITPLCSLETQPRSNAFSLELSAFLAPLALYSAGFSSHPY